MELFKNTGTVVNTAPRQRSARWPAPVYDFVKEFAENNPCFYIEELQEQLLENFPDLSIVSVPTICRALRHDLKFSRKVLEKRARESVPFHLKEYYWELSQLYSFPEQLLFIDESSKDGRDVLRRHGWSRINTPAIAYQPFSRGGRVSVLAAFDTSGFCAWKCTEGTFTRQRFHKAFIENVVPLLQPWPMPRSIVILDNARIHMYAELEQVIHGCCARILYLPPYSPQLNPIEKGFGLLKHWLQKEAHHAFRECPELVMDVAMKECFNARLSGHSFYASCGYGHNALIPEVFGLSDT